MRDRDMPINYNSLFLTFCSGRLLYPTFFFFIFIFQFWSLFFLAFIKLSLPLPLQTMANRNCLLELIKMSQYYLFFYRAGNFFPFSSHLELDVYTYISVYLSEFLCRGVEVFFHDMPKYHRNTALVEHKRTAI